MRLIDADALMRCIPTEDITSRFAIENAPIIDAEPVKHGRWSPDCVCSECGEVPRSGMEENYCPNCGAKNG